MLTGRRGFIPVPFAFGDPVVGFGGGLGIVFYQPPPLKNADTVDMRRPPPSVGIGGFYTSQSAWGVAGGVYRPWHNDRFRYLGIIGGGQAGLNYFGVRDSPFQHNPLDYNFETGRHAAARAGARRSTSRSTSARSTTYVHTRSTVRLACSGCRSSCRARAEDRHRRSRRQPRVRHAQQLPRRDRGASISRRRSPATRPGSAAPTDSAGSTRTRSAMRSRGTCGGSPADST